MSILAILFAPQSSRSAFDEQMKYPVVWRIAYYEDSEPWKDVRVTLYEDGSASLRDAPGGEIRASGKEKCVAASGELYSGDAKWASDDRGRIVVTYPGGNVLIIPRLGRFGTYDWHSVGQELCDGNLVMFATD
ncbi:hypothetical protein J2Y69_003599 [Microbacterium resistens]|uniref:Uncharacterized protein n=1 Tax=Microbacterium resistens TaxID=156977 RepID=A0ABU1SH78_9MICO|nr:hypothetical protein [Microbacterium resistens]MDR6868971.1 hypothetical protein [Microbacterium resistens]